MSFLLNIYIDLKELIYLLFYLGNTDLMSFRFLDFFEVHMIWGGFALYRHMLDRFTLYRCVRFKLYFIYLAVHCGRLFTVILYSHNTQIYVVQMRPICIVLYLSCCTLGQSVYSHIAQSQYTDLRCTDGSSIIKLKAILYRKVVIGWILILELIIILPSKSYVWSWTNTMWFTILHLDFFKASLKNLKNT